MTEAKISFLLLHPLGKSVVGDTADFPPLIDYIEAFEKFEDRTNLMRCADKSGGIGCLIHRVRQAKLGTIG